MVACGCVVCCACICVQRADSPPAGVTGGSIGIGLPLALGAAVACPDRRVGALDIGETGILLHPPLPLVGVSIDMARECQQFDSLADG